MALLTTPAARLAVITDLLHVEGDIAQRTFTTVNDRAAAFVEAMFDRGYTAEYFDSNTVRVDGLTVSRWDHCAAWSYNILASDRETVAADQRAAASQRLQARDAATEAWSNAGGVAIACGAVRNVLTTLGCVTSFVCESDVRVTFGDGSIIDLDIDPNIDGFDYEGSTDDAELLQDWADATGHADQAASAYAALLKVKALADDASAWLAAAIISTKIARTQSFNAGALHASAQCALITLETLASVTECAAKRAAADAAATRAADAKDAKAAAANA